MKAGNVHVVEAVHLIADHGTRDLSTVVRAVRRIRGLRRLLELHVVRGVAAHSKLQPLKDVRCRDCKKARWSAGEECVSRPRIVEQMDVYV